MVIMMLCLILFGLLQVSYIIAARNVLQYTAVATVRAAAIGLNDSMLLKVSHYASIPTAGPMNRPGNLGHMQLPGNSMGEKLDHALTRRNTPESAQGWYEIAVKADFHLAADNEYRAILNYDNWDAQNEAEVRTRTDFNGDLVETTVGQAVPMTFPFARAFARHLVAGGSLVAVPRTVPHKDSSSGMWTSERTTREYPAVPVVVDAVMENHANHYLQDY
jgi:hypothetical protein